MDEHGAEKCEAASWLTSYAELERVLPKTVKPFSDNIMRRNRARDAGKCEAVFGSYHAQK
jgi:hypothetical protein